MTAAGNIGVDYPDQIPVASYPTVQSPWGLFDLSGSRTEWTDTLFNPGYDRSRLVLGTWAESDLSSYYDNIQWNASQSPAESPFGNSGFRIVIIPESGIGQLILLLCMPYGGGGENMRLELILKIVFGGSNGTCLIRIPADLRATPRKQGDAPGGILRHNVVGSGRETDDERASA